MPALRRQLLSGLLFECPYHGSNPPDCPLDDVRKRDLEARLDWLDSLSDEEVERLLATHTLCLAHQEKS